MRTNRHPGDYDRIVPTPPAVLFATCPACGYNVAVKAGCVKEGPHKGSKIINCYRCNTFDQIELSPEEQTKQAACSICTLAQAMRVCKVCAFGAYAEQHKVDLLAFVDDWAADPWTPEDIASEQMNHRPETTF